MSLRTVERACAPYRQQLLASALATVRFETRPGEQMQIDFGERRVWIGKEPVRVHLFVATSAFREAKSPGLLAPAARARLSR